MYVCEYDELIASELTIEEQTYNPKARKYSAVRKLLYDVDFKDGIRYMRFDAGHIQNEKIESIVGSWPEVIVDTDALDEIKKLFSVIPRDYQYNAALYALRKKRTSLLMCTGSGKSLTITLIVEYLRRKNLKGILLVPNVNLLTQFNNDILNYLGNTDYVTLLGAKFKKIDTNADLLISTWQSLHANQERFNAISKHFCDFLICDEAHKYTGDAASAIVRALPAKYKISLTGTLPNTEYQRKVLFGLFGAPKNIIDLKQLVAYNNATPIRATNIMLHYNTSHDNNVLANSLNYLDCVKYVTSIQSRTEFITNLATKLQERMNGSVLVLYTLTAHGLTLYDAIKNASAYADDVYFMNGDVDANEREQIRKEIDVGDNGVLVANYALLSTGVNIRKLRYLIFASPLRSVSTITQSLGRGCRQAENKHVFDVFDIVDVFKRVNMFVRSNSHRNTNVYRKLCMNTRTVVKYLDD